MKKWIVILVVVAGAAAVQVGGMYYKGQPSWTVESGSGPGLVLSVKADSSTTSPPTVQIRCDGRTAELRLLLATKIRILPPAGQPAGPPTLVIGEQFLDRDRQTVATGDAGRSADWIVSDDRTYAFRTGASDFIDQMVGQEWLRLASLGFSGDSLVSSILMVPLRNLAEHKARIAAACKTER